MTLPRSDKKNGTCQHSQGQLEDKADDKDKDRAEQSVLIGRGKSWSRGVKEIQSAWGSSKNNPVTRDLRKRPVDLPMG